MPLDVICPMCAESCFETTKFYDPNKLATTRMLKLKKQHIAAGGTQWDELPYDGLYGDIVCGYCGNLLAPEGHLMVRKQVLPPGQLPNNSGKGKWICPVCQREFKSKANLGAHMRVHK